MKRHIAFFLALLCLFSVLTGCGGKKELDPQALADDLLANAGFVDSLNKLEPVIVPMLYAGLSADDYSDVLAYAGTGATAEEIVIFTAKSEDAAKRIRSAAETHIKDRIESFKNYGPAASLALENAVLKQSGKYVVVVVCSDGKTAAKIADKYI